MKNFYDIQEFPIFSIKLEDLLTTVNQELKYYLNNTPNTERLKYITIIKTPFIKMYSILINHNHNIFVGKEDKNELFNVCIDTPEQNYNNGNDGLMVEEIRKCFDMTYYPYHTLPYFIKTRENIPQSTITSWILLYKKGAIVKPHRHNDNIVLIHFLLEDIKDGTFEITVNNETRLLSKKGEYFIFCGSSEHSAQLTGNKAQFFVTTIDINNNSST